MCLDTDIDPEHSELADRHDVIYELKYSQLVDILNGITDDNDNNNTGRSSSLQKKDGTNEEGQLVSQKLTEAVENTISLKNGKRSTLGKEELADWYRQYALLQGTQLCE